MHTSLGRLLPARFRDSWMHFFDTFTDTLELDLATVEPSIAGPRRPQDRIPLRQSKELFQQHLSETLAGSRVRVQRLAQQAGGQVGRDTQTWNVRNIRWQGEQLVQRWIFASDSPS